MDADVKRRLDDLTRGISSRVSTFSITGNGSAVTSTINRTGISSGDLIVVMPFAGAATFADINRIVPARNSFTVFHTAAATSRTFRYSVITNASG